MAMIRSVAFGGVAALGVPTAVDDLSGELGDFIRGISQPFEFGGIWLHWSWTIFVVVTTLTFILLAVTRER